MLNFGPKNEKRPFALIVLDGWGIAPVWGGNAISLGHLPNFNLITKRFPYTTLLASDGAVGLPKDAPGNSEAGHLNIGAGRVVYQDQPIIDKQIDDGSFFKNDVILKAVEHAQKNNSNLHLVGLLSKTGTHAQINHLYALLKILREKNFSRVYIHLFGDGRDSEPMSGIEMLAEVESKIALFGIGQIASVVGRFYAMDRDNHWDRIKRAYELLVSGKGASFPSAGEVFAKSYARGVTDEFVEPSIVISKGKNPEFVSDNDAVIFFNYRADRAKEITQAFLDPKLTTEIPGRKMLTNLFFATFVMHGDETLGNHVFLPEGVADPIGSIWSAHNLRQYHSAETEKYAHVTYFMNGGREEPFPGEDRLVIPSPNVETYDQMPEMSAKGVTASLLSAINRKVYDAYIVNFANADMVGHTGNLKATVKAVEFVDKCLGEVIAKFISVNGCVFVCADHGNAEQMVNPRTGEPDTEHTTNPVPFCIVSNDPALQKIKLAGDGALCNITPSILDVMGIPFDHRVKAKSLIVR